MCEYRGWLLDLYTDPDKHLKLWFIGEDGRRQCLYQPFPICFHISGPFPRLRQAWKYLRRQQSIPTKLSRQKRNELFAGMLDVLTVEVQNPDHQPKLFQQLRRRFPDLDYYDADIPITVCYAASHNIFPLNYCHIITNDQNQIQSIQSLESRWQIDTTSPPLRVLSIQPDTDPNHNIPTKLTITCGPKSYTIPIRNARQILIHLRSFLKRHDPDIILSDYGDTWLFPYLREAQKAEPNIRFNLNRDQTRQTRQKKATSYHTYGNVVHKGQQTHLFGRIHIDRYNAMMFGDYDLTGIIEQAAVTGLPIQETARRSPGAGITAMQFIVALQKNILIPYQKQQSEFFKTANQLLKADRGGLVYQPTIGLHRNVAEIDFVSMYPSIMCAFNLSPETVSIRSHNIETVPELGIPVDQSQVGLVPETLRPLLAKRVALTQRLATLTRRDCRYQPLKARSNALKWLLVVSFGYLGYKRARFGRIEAHEAVTAYGREALLLAKEAAEDLGFVVLHMYVDGLWVKHKSACTAEHTQSLLDEITSRTRLPIALKGIYNFIAFLPSRHDKRIPVPNRYYGAFLDKTIKMRGIETRRHDTPPFIAHLQEKILHIMAANPPDQSLRTSLPSIFILLSKYQSALQQGQIPQSHLIVNQTLSRAVGEYRVPSPAARAAAQLQQVGKERYPGQRIKFYYTLGDPGVHAHDHPIPLDLRTIDTERYTTLMVRAAANVLQPLGIEETELYNVLHGYGYQLHLPLNLATNTLSPDNSMIEIY